MAIIVDADVIIRGEKGIFDLKRWAASITEDHLEIAAITVAELWHGVERAIGSHKTRRLEYLQTILGSVPILP
jgi:predicted nucleic acid-binding protein